MHECMRQKRLGTTEMHENFFKFACFEVKCKVRFLCSTRGRVAGRDGESHAFGTAVCRLGERNEV